MIKFFREVLGMKVSQADCLGIQLITCFVQVLRHEEFTEGCKAACNGYVLLLTDAVVYR